MFQSWLSHIMLGEPINRFSRRAIVLLSAFALLTVISGYFQAPEPDEGASAHIFQLAIAALTPMFMLFFATADWKKPPGNARLLALPAAARTVAFAALYYLEHYFYFQHHR